MPKFQHHHNFIPKFEKINKHSLTVPNESYSIKELLLKHKNGILPPIVREVFFDENSDFDSFDFEKINMLDDPEKQEFLLQNRNNIKRMFNELDIKQNKQVKEQTIESELVKEEKNAHK